MPSIADIEDEIVDELSMFDNWMDRYGYIIEIGKGLPALDAQYKTDAHRVHGCQSMVWLNTFEQDGVVCYEADSDAFITKGLIGLLVRVLSGQPAQDIADAPLTFIDRAGIRKHLSPNRSNGLGAMVATMKRQALAQLIKREGQDLPAQTAS
ncbi:MAG: SufE family protein [Bacteroidota bacterium]